MFIEGESWFRVAPKLFLIFLDLNVPFLFGTSWVFIGLCFTSALVFWKMHQFIHWLSSKAQLRLFILLFSFVQILFQRSYNCSFILYFGKRCILVSLLKRDFLCFAITLFDTFGSFGFAGLLLKIFIVIVLIHMFYLLSD